MRGGWGGCGRRGEGGREVGCVYSLLSGGWVGLACRVRFLRISGWEKRGGGEFRVGIDGSIASDRMGGNIGD